MNREHRDRDSRSSLSRILWGDNTHGLGASWWAVQGVVIGGAAIYLLISGAWWAVIGIPWAGYALWRASRDARASSF
jgi:hypothetical protein